VSNQAPIYFFILSAILILFSLDAVRKKKKYSSAETTEATHSYLDAEMQVHMRLFRDQRNFDISGFALLLLLVIRRLVILISQHASILAKSEATIRQAESATTTAQSLLAQNQISAVQNDTNAAHEKEVTL
jgi:B-cell receptor-associated protein 31